MEVLYPRCAGLDVHSGNVVACVRLAAGAEVPYEHRTVPTTTRGLLDLDEWLGGHHVTHVAIEATGIYWKPVWHVLDGHVTLILANAMHIRSVPGRKSDVNDATWIADKKDSYLRAQFLRIKSRRGKLHLMSCDVPEDLYRQLDDGVGLITTRWRTIVGSPRALVSFARSRTTAARGFAPPPRSVLALV